MNKRIAVLAVNPVNGFGLFQYLETFFENGIIYKVYAVANQKSIRTNSGISIETYDVIKNLVGHAKEFDGLVFACGDAIPTFKEHADDDYNKSMLHVIKEFSDEYKLMIGHCAAALIFEKAGITTNKKVAVHPLAKPAILKGIVSEKPIAIDDNFYTAQDEHFISSLMPELLNALK